MDRRRPGSRLARNAAAGGMRGGMLVLTCQAEGDNTSVLWTLMPWYGNANKAPPTADRMVAYGTNRVNEAGPNLIKLWDSADWRIKYMHAKFNIPTPFNNRVFVPSYDGTNSGNGLDLLWHM
jgi:hypothetical protein